MTKRSSFTALSILILFGGCRQSQINNVPVEMRPEQVKNVMTKVADWQLANPSRHNTAEWTHGALFAGLTAWAQMADTDKYYEALLGFGKKNNWNPHKRVYHADDHAVAQMYIEMYKKYKDPEMIRGIRDCFNTILGDQPTSAMKMEHEDDQDRWNWCDALFMGPPVWAKLARVTGESKYMEYMNKEWQATTDFLYDKDEHLYYRDSRYFDRREENGKKIFWSRGNGWVIAGLVRVLEEMPADYPDRPKYEKVYKEMAAKLVAIQPEEGLWHSSLLDPVSFPTIEASGSGFHCYGLAWGINHGYLNEKDYLPAVIKAWTGLVSCVQPDGKLGYVQPIGADPRHVTADQTDIYGVGSFLLAGSEVYKIGLRKGMPVKEITVVNPINEFRDSETISLDWNKIKNAVDGLTKENVAIYEFKSNRLLVTQYIEDKNNAELLFQTNLAPGEKKCFWVMKQPEGFAKSKSKLATYCRFVPEREDDFTWENDVIAFRMYGPALWDDAVNTGVDCWLKRVNYPIINKWYSQMKEKTYHTDWGEGYDPYHVGKTAGCGGLRIVEDDKFIHSNVYDEWKVVANGPIRSIFELTYNKSWKASGRNMIETKRVTIDLGQRLCRFESCFTGADAPKVKQFAVGVTTHDGKAQSYDNVAKGIAYCWEKIDGHYLGTAAIVVSPTVERSKTVASENKDENHIYLITNKATKPAITYYVGYGWERAGQITTVESWQAYLENFKKRIDNPVNILLVE